MTAPIGSIDASIERILDEALERRLRPILAELAEVRAALRTRPAEEDALLTPKQAAQHLKLTPQTVNRWISSGKLPAVGPPRARRVKRSVADRFMALQPNADDAGPDLDALAETSLRRRHRP